MLTYEHRIRALVEGVPEPCVFLGALLGAQSPEGGSRAYVPSVRPTYALAPIPFPSYPPIGASPRRRGNPSGEVG